MLDTIAQRACWSTSELRADPSWNFELSDSERDQLIDLVRGGRVEGRDLLDYRPDDFALSRIPEPVIAAFEEAYRGRGSALLHGLPREGVSEEEFALMTWVIGLAAGVALPQGKASQYLSPVRDAGQSYRNASGRGYNTNSDLEFHIDGGELVALTCYNTAKAGGQSMVASSWKAYEIFSAERPDLLDALHEPIAFNNQGEEALGEPPFRLRPIYALLEGRPHCGFNRNRIQAAQTHDDVERLTDKQKEAMTVLDEILRRPDVLFTMHLAPGDMQILNNHFVIHSRTGFEDHSEFERKRLLYRLWIMPPHADALPPSLADFYGSSAPNILRGGIKGHHYDERCRAFETALSKYHAVVDRPSE